MKYTTCPYCGLKLNFVDDKYECMNHNYYPHFDNNKDIISFLLHLNNQINFIDIYEDYMKITIINSVKIDAGDLRGIYKPIILPIDNNLTPENVKEKLKLYLNFS
jgi:hypothetical protein